MRRRIVKYGILLVGILGLTACEKTGRTGMEFQLEGLTEGVSPLLKTKDRTYELIPDSLGFVVFHPTKEDKSEEGVFEYGKYRLLLYLQPEKYTEVFVNLDTSALGAEFRGEGSIENEILNGKYRTSDSDIDFCLEEKAFISVLEMKMQTYGRLLDSLGLESRFTERMKEKEKYRLFAALGYYPELHAGMTEDKNYRPSGFYTDYVRKLILDDGALLAFEEYREALPAWIKIYSGKDLQKGDAFESLQSALQFIDTAFTDPGIREFVIDNRIVGYVEKEGIDSLTKLEAIYRMNVKEAGRIKRFLHLCEAWKKIRPGEAALPLRGYTRDSSVVALTDYKGRYIYLLFWKTGCPASRREVKYMKEVNLRFKRRKIVFVAVSCDRNRKEWEKFLTREQAGGIQWFAENADSELEYYRIRQLPHAVLIDPDGKIAEVSVALPSENGLETDLQKAGV